MLPNFNPDGRLPAGIHLARLDEVLARFGTGSERRAWLAERLKEVVELAKSTGKLERLFVYGSFVTAKEEPNDLDVLLVMSPDFVRTDYTGRVRQVFEDDEARIGFCADIGWTRSFVAPAALQGLLEICQTTREHKPYGIVEVMLT